MFSWFEKRIEAFPKVNEKQPQNKLSKFCMHYTKGVWSWLFVMAACTSAIAVIEIVLFNWLGNIINWLSDSNKAHFFTQHKFSLLIFGVVSLILLPVIVAIKNMVVYQSLLCNFPLRIRWAMHKYLLDQSVDYFQNESAGKICAKIMQTSIAIRETMLKLLDVFNYVVVYFAGTLILAASADWRIMLGFIGWLTAYVALLAYFIPKLREASEQQADSNTTMVGRIVDAYTNISTVKLFSHNAREEEYAKEAMKQYQAGVTRQMRLISKFSISIYFLNCILLFVVTTIGLLLWQKNLLAVGAVAVATGLALRLNGMAQWVMWEMTALFENIGIASDGMKALSVKCAIEDKAQALELKVAQGDIEFKNVDFNYNQTPLFSNFNLKIKAGQKVGIVGRSGAGKSSLVNLLLRFYDLDNGGIYIDGQNIVEVTQESLRSHIAMVSQDTSLLHRSLRENIAYGKPNATDEEILKAASQADALEFICNLEDYQGNKGLDVYVGERGAKLSGGQRQRVAISRVMLKNAPILILDEATSALDSEAEMVIQNNLEDLMKGKTVLAIAHRLSTIAKMDRLLIMDKGQIVEDGTHEELLAKNGLYASLWRRQAGGELILEQAA